MSDITNAKIITYQFNVPIERSSADVWNLMINDINEWWMNDFRALGQDSTIALSAIAGGQLIESAADNSTLEWYRVQMVMPKKSIHLVGYLAPDWGGPTSSMLKLAFEDRDTGSTLVVSDALMGNVTAASAKSAEDGWKILFGEGLKKYAEK